MMEYEPPILPGATASYSGSRNAGPRSFSIYAYRRSDQENTSDERRRRLPLSQLEAAARWAVGGGRDEFVVSLDDADPVDPANHGCDDPSCPGGC